MSNVSFAQAPLLRQLATSAILSSPGRFELSSQPIPEPAADEICLRLRGCGLCGSNIPIWEGREWFEYPQSPGAPGHEGWGVIEKVGADVTGLKPGQPVACLTYHAFATHDLAKSTQVVLLPNALAKAHFPGEPLACAMNIFRRCQIQPGEKVAVIGIGFIGALLIQLAADAGAQVTAISRRKFSLEIASRCGAENQIELADDQTLQHLQGSFSCVIEATGLEQTLELSSHLVDVRGRLVIAGYHQDGLRSINMQLWNWKGIDVINAHERDPQIYIQGMQEAVAAVESGRLRPQELITHEFPLSEINQAFRMATERPEGFLKAVVLT